MEVQITKLGKHHLVKVDGTEISSVTDYKITSSAHGGAELELKISCDAEITKFELSTS